MTRREIREHSFRIIFLKEFYEKEELPEQISYYLSQISSGREEELTYIENRACQVFEHLEEIDSQIESASSGWRLNRMGKVDLTILRLAVFEIQLDEEIPVSVAINEAVEIAKKYGEDNSASFINGILGKIVKKE